MVSVIDRMILFIMYSYQRNCKNTMQICNRLIGHSADSGYRRRQTAHPFCILHSAFQHSAPYGRLWEYGQHFQVGSHNIAHPADLGVTPEFINRAPATFPTFTKCFQSNIQPDFMTVFEAIDDGLGKAVNFMSTPSSLWVSTPSLSAGQENLTNFIGRLETTDNKKKPLFSRGLGTSLHLIGLIIGAEAGTTQTS